MLLSLQFLLDVGNVNQFRFTQQIEYSAGDTQNLYFQLVDLSVDRSDEGFQPPGRRYMPPATSTLSITFLSVECQKEVIRSAVQPFTQDPSIWMVPILGSDPLQGTVQMKARLQEPTRTLNFSSGKGVVLRIR